jgi:Xaa-Pro aminopeptidase
VNSDSGLQVAEVQFDGVEKLKAYMNSDYLYNALSKARMKKSNAEIELMRYCSWVTSNAHVAVMRDAKPGVFDS